MATAVAEFRPMAKKAGRPKGPERNEGTVRLDRILISRARMVASYRGVSVGEFLSEIVKAPLDKAYAQMIRDSEAGQG